MTKVSRLAVPVIRIRVVHEQPVARVVDLVEQQVWTVVLSVAKMLGAERADKHAVLHRRDDLERGHELLLEWLNIGNGLLVYVKNELRKQLVAIAIALRDTLEEVRYLPVIEGQNAIRLL